VVEASGGAAAEERLRAGRDVDVVLLDMNMPGMGGLETLRQLRGLPGDVARLPVIAMTADALDHERQAYLAAGLDGYVTKPIYLNALRAEIATVLARHR
jgi:CheY-like chemotaxis protein